MAGAPPYRSLRILRFPGRGAHLPVSGQHAPHGRVQCIDYCIHRIVAALNAGGIRTVASCCGHKRMPGNIMLEDGRVLVIVDSLDQVVWQAKEQ